MSQDAIRRFLDFMGLEGGPQSACDGALLLAGDILASEVGTTAPASLVVGWREGVEHQRILDRLSGGRLTSVSAIASGSYDLHWSSGDGREFPEVAGMRLTLSCASDQLVCFPRLSEVRDPQIEVIASLNGQPWFVRVATTGKPVYILGVTSVPDVDAPVGSESEEPKLLSTVVALVLFLRKYFPTHAWTPGSTFANFIIDDPFLKPTYGFVNHERLAAQVRSLDVAATIAFIPWNARRSRRTTVDVFKRTKGLSLCVHGDEHTGGEFADTDLAHLRSKALHAVARMEQHANITGLSFEPMMVFPQGRFSVEAMEALSQSGFLAAINSHVMAENHEGRVRSRDLIEPATTCYGAFPLFLRRYPSEAALLRYDHVLGRPLLLAEHHQYFEDGGSAFARVVQEVSTTFPGVLWRSTGEIATRVHMHRQASSGLRQVRFYGDRFSFTAPAGGSVRYEFQKTEARDGGVERVLINDGPVDFAHVKGRLVFETVLASNVDIRIQLVRARPNHRVERGPQPLSHRLKVAARRYLSDFRDDHVHTNRILNACLSAARRRA